MNRCRGIGSELDMVVPFVMWGELLGLFFQEYLDVVVVLFWDYLLGFFFWIWVWFMLYSQWFFH